jgi:hypothetical protein
MAASAKAPGKAKAAGAKPAKGGAAGKPAKGPAKVTKSGPGKRG